jgi:hypothetical protein
MSSCETIIADDQRPGNIQIATNATNATNAAKQRRSRGHLTQRRCSFAVRADRYLTRARISYARPGWRSGFRSASPTNIDPRSAVASLAACVKHVSSKPGHASSSMVNVGATPLTVLLELWQ